MEQFLGVAIGLVALVVCAVVARLIKRHFERKRRVAWQAQQPAPSRQVRRAQQRKR
ncbi:MAG: hypothetical protein V4505_00105 [Pseudomonadota bacterium]|jgi:hypothetical protein